MDIHNLASFVALAAAKVTWQAFETGGRANKQADDGSGRNLFQVRRCRLKHWRGHTRANALTIGLFAIAGAFKSPLQALIATHLALPGALLCEEEDYDDDDEMQSSSWASRAGWQSD